MDLNFTADEQAFRVEVRGWLNHTLPYDLSERVRLGKRLGKFDIELWHSLLNERGWLAPNWPRQYGGCDWNAAQRHIYEEEACLAHAPRTLPFGLNMLAPVLMAFGSELQRQKFLPRILTGRDWWCQGYSEPGAGSDLAALKTRAVREGDDYVVNGQKTWTTLGQYANWIFCLVRTNLDVKKQEGISFLLMDMNAPGVTVRPIVLLDGQAEVNEVFFNNVWVPVENLVGEVDKGWTYAKYLLTHERTNIAGTGFSNAALETLKHVADQVHSGGKPLSQNLLFAARVAQVEIDLMAMATTNLRMVSAAAQGQAPGPESSMLKVKGTVIRQELTSLLRRAMGPDAMPFQLDCLQGGDNAEAMGPDHAAAAAPNYFNMRKLSIFGGSNEVQRTIITKNILGF